MTASFEINGTTVGGDHGCYVIAEMSANHNGDFDEAVRIIKAAKDAGCQAVKIQTYRADTITLKSDRADFRLPGNNSWETFGTLYDLYEKACTPWEWHEQLFDEARKVGITIFSSPFDLTAVDLLENLDAPAYKIASPEITDIPLIEKVAQTGKPVIVSTGLGNLDDITLAVDTLKSNGCENFAILRCTTAYPSPPSEINLSLLPDIASKFDCVVGLSDHTIGQAVPLSSIHYQAKIIEKHFVLDQSESVDGFFSMTAAGFKSMIDDIRVAEQAIGTINYNITESAQKNYFARRSLYISSNVKAGDMLSSKNVQSVRPGYGLHPKYYKDVMGLKFASDKTAGDRLLAEDIIGFLLDSEDLDSK